MILREFKAAQLYNTIACRLVARINSVLIVQDTISLHDATSVLCVRCAKNFVIQ